jgi:hypothetical protein
MTTETETPNTEAEITAELSKPEEISEYVAERTEQIAEEQPPVDEADKLAREVRDRHPEHKQASRYQRLKASRDRAIAEAAELRAKLGTPSTDERETYSDTQAPSGDAAPTPEIAQIESSLQSARHLYGDAFDNAYQSFIEHVRATGDQAAYQRVMESGDVGAALVAWHNEMGNPSPSPEAYEAAMQQGREQQEFHQQLAERDAEIEVRTAARLRSEAFAAECSDFYETVGSLEGIDVPPLMIDLIRRSAVGPEMAYVLAKDYWAPNTNGWLDQATELANDPIAQARFVGALEQQVLSLRSKGGLGAGAAQRATKAPPPLSSVRGGANPPRDLQSMASKDDVGDYIAARRRAS